MLVQRQLQLVLSVASILNGSVMGMVSVLDVPGGDGMSVGERL